MAPDDVTQIFSQLREVLQRLSRIEERTNVLTDHETRIRAAEEAARKAGDTAIVAKATAEAQAVRIRTLEDAQSSTGKFTLPILGRFLVGFVGMVVAVATVAVVAHNW